MNLPYLALVILLPILSFAIVLAFLRLLWGPSLPDRVIALDLLTTLAVGIIGIFAVATNQPAFLDITLILALITFLGTVAFAYYIERRRA